MGVEDYHDFIGDPYPEPDEQGTEFVPDNQGAERARVRSLMTRQPTALEQTLRRSTGAHIIMPENLPPPIAGPGRPNRYKLESGKVVPSVTTVTDRFKDSTGLIIWAHGQGMEGIPLNEARDNAGAEGTMTHQWIEDHIHGRPLTTFDFSDPDELARALRAFDGWQKWAAAVDLRMLETEVPLVSEELKLGGTPDGVGYVDGVLSIVDWKSGNAIYLETIVQIAAYREMLLERHGVDKAPEQGVAVRLDKETGEPMATLLEPEVLDMGWRYFDHARDMYELAKDLNKIVRRAKDRDKAAKAARESAANG